MLSPLGIIQQQVWSRPEAEFGKKHQRKERPISDKESFKIPLPPLGKGENKWLKSLQATAQLQQQLENTLLVSVGDREADFRLPCARPDVPPPVCGGIEGGETQIRIDEYNANKDVYELFVEAQQLSQDILVRASWNRCVDHKEKYLWEQMQSHPVAGALTITVPRQQKQEQREATLSIRHALVRLRPPQRPKGNKLPSVTVYAVLALEEQAPKDVKPIEWLLLTSVPIYHFDDASQRLAWYTCRWVIVVLFLTLIPKVLVKNKTKIEIYHKVLKSGCRVEQRQFENAPRIGRYLAVDSVVAWRVDLITMLGRELPEMPCDAILAAHEWQALYCFIHLFVHFDTHSESYVEMDKTSDQYATTKAADACGGNTLDSANGRILSTQSRWTTGYHCHLAWLAETTRCGKSV